MNVIIRRASLITAIFCFISYAGFSQTTLNLYPLNGVIGVRFFSEKKISLEPRLDFQFDHVSASNNLFLTTEIFTLYNFCREDKFKLYTGLGMGANFYNQAQSNFTGSLPLGATYYIDDNKRIGIIGECGMKFTALDFLQIRSYVLVGIQIGLKKKE
jgi:hypothetical protein